VGPDIHVGDERHLARLGAAQDGIVRLDQLNDLGLTSDQRRTRLAQRRLIAQYPGVYAVGHDELTERGRFRAVVWAGGEGALLSGRAAARLLGLWERPVREMAITVPFPRCPRLRGVTRASGLGPLDRTHVRGIACLSVSRLLVELARAERPPAVEAVFERAERKGWIRPDLIERMAYNRPGAAILRPLLASHRPKSQATKSILERRLLAGIRKTGLPEPVVNGLLDLGDITIEPDLMWPRERVLVELDGLDTHGTRTAMRRDRRRDRRTLLAGWVPLRFTSDDVEHDLGSVLRDIAGTTTLWAPSSPS
jgi:very-short-patch-repair endonuclease